MRCQKAASAVLELGPSGKAYGLRRLRAKAIIQRTLRSTSGAMVQTQTSFPTAIAACTPRP